MTRRGRLVALEGIDGSGKSSLQRALVGRLRRDGWRVARWHEPTRAALGRTAQELSPEDPAGAAIHFTLDRLLARPRLERLLARMDVVLSDRSFYSTLAYQGSALPARDGARLARWQRAVAREPDLVLWLDLPVTAAMQRVDRRGRSRAPLERRATLARVDRAYRRMARDSRWWTLDARQEPRPLADGVAERLQRWLGRK